MNARVLVTGASGFIGAHVCRRMAQAGYRVRAVSRTGRAPVGVDESGVVQIGADTDWTAALREVDFVVHAAGLAPVPGSANDTGCFEQVNLHGTATLAAAAAAARVRRLVFISSIKVNGEGGVDHAYGPDDAARPEDGYALSKWRGEQALARTCANSGTQYAIVRPPLVYGEGVGGNFLQLMHWIDRGFPLPLAAVRNRRSLVGVWNLADLLARLLEADVPANRTWMVADEEDVSTAELVRRLSKAMGRRARLLAVPESLLRVAGRIGGRSSQVQRLCGSLRADVSRTRELLGWSPPLSLDAGLARTADWYTRRASA